MTKITLGVFYWHNPTRLGNLELIGRLRQDFKIVIISNYYESYIERYCDYLIVDTFRNYYGILKKLKAYKEKHGIDGLITLSEGAVTLMADTAFKLNLLGNDPDKTRAARNKYLMRESMDKVGIPQPQFYKAYSLNEALSISDVFNEKRFFLKPPCIGGSAYCSIIENKDQLKSIWNKFFQGSMERTRNDPLFEEQFGKDGKNYYLMLEELLGGTKFEYDDILGPIFPIFEMSVEGFINGNTTYIYSMTDKLLPNSYRHAQEYMWRMHSRVPPKLKEILCKRVNVINNILNATCGCSHTEFRIEITQKEYADIKFKDNYYRARLIETALRPGGAFMQPAIAMATGFNSIKAMSYQACGLDNQEKVIFRFPLIMANLWADKPGKLIRIEGLDKILSLKDKLASFHLYDGIGDTIAVPPFACRGIADAVIYGNTKNLLDYQEWEIKCGENNLYKDVEQIYLEVKNNFKPIVIEDINGKYKKET